MRWLLSVALLIAACGGSESNETLTLSGGTRTEDEFRSEMRGFLLQIDAQRFCDSLSGLSPREVVDALKAYNRANEPDETPAQSPDASDEDRAGAIVLEECARIN